MINTKITPELIEGFWQSVHDDLKSRFRFSSDRAWGSINRYRAELEHFGVREMVYHHEPQDIAASLARRGKD